MVVFALVNTPDGGFYIASSIVSMGWRGLPHDLAAEMEDVRENGEEVEEVSIGKDGDWFLRTDSRHSRKVMHVSQDMVSNVDIFLALAKSGGLDLSQYMIQFFTFVPDPTGYVCVLHKDDGSLSRCAWRDVPAELDALLEREASQGVRHVTVGADGAYVLLMNSGVIWWSEQLPAPLIALLDQAERSGRRVHTVSLSLLAASWYYVEFADGGVHYSLPAAWHPAIDKHTARNAPRHSMATAYHSPQSSFSSSSSSGFYTPHHASSYPSYFGAGTAYQPPMHAPAPVYNFTTVYNEQSPQPPKQSSTTRTFELIGGALKVAGAVLDITGGMGGFGGF